eukprot:scaffold330178_cov97-Tisochrysis_lutea.AAC.3
MDENRRNASGRTFTVRPCKCHPANALGANTMRMLPDVCARKRASDNTPAAWSTPRRGCSCTAASAVWAIAAASASVPTLHKSVPCPFRATRPLRDASRRLETPCFAKKVAAHNPSPPKPPVMICAPPRGRCVAVKCSSIASPHRSREV